MLTLASAVLIASLCATPPKAYVDPRVKQMAEEAKVQERQLVDKKHKRRDEKAMCKASCQQVANMCVSNCRGQKACKDNCTDKVEKGCLKGCANRQ